MIPEFSASQQKSISKTSILRQHLVKPLLSPDPIALGVVLTFNIWPWGV